MAIEVCGSCGQQNPDGFRLCGMCGMPLAAGVRASAAGRKTVTVLFADIVDSTPLGERLDPEALERVKARYFDEIRIVLERHGGSVEKFIGDAVMAVFGIPVVHEDDALRAVRAASEISERLSALNEELQHDHGVTISIRTGINTGEVVAGDPLQGQTFATGDAVNVAARLEQAAQPGEILLGEKTFDLVKDAVDVQPVAPFSVKGKNGEIRVWRAERVAAAAQPFSRRLDAVMVGRDSELTQLRQAYERALERRTPSLFTVLGPAGIGKSRLAHELVVEVGSEAHVLTGRCLPYGEGITYWPLLEVFRRAAANPALARALAQDEAGRLVVNRVAEAAGFVQLGSTSDEIFWAARKLLEALARDRPLIVLFDDLHWAEPTLLDLVEYLVDWSSDAPILVVCLARPDLVERRPAWAGGKLNATSILLEPLSRSEAETLIDRVVGRHELSGSTRSRIADAAEGNPLFVEQIVAMLAETGSAEADISIPPSIQALLAARLDQLPRAERALLERASIVGKEFSRSAVAALSDGEDVVPYLQTLVRKQFIVPDRSRSARDEGFQFHHLLIRDATYEAIRKEVRAELHERLADWIAGESEEHDELLGYHLEQAVLYRRQLRQPDERDRALAVRAAERLAVAGTRALAREDDAAAANLLRRATSLFPADDPRALEVLVDLGRALEGCGELAEAEAVFEEVIARARADGDRRLELHGVVGLVDLRSATDPSFRIEELTRTAEQAIPVFEALGDEHGLAKTWSLLLWLHWTQCEHAGSEAAAERAYEHARAAGDRRTESKMLTRVASVPLGGPVPVEEGLRRCDDVLARAEGSLVVEGSVLRTRAGLMAMQGRFAEARSLMARAMQIRRELGQTIAAASASMVEAHIEILAGDPVAAERVLREGYKALEQAGEKSYLSTVTALLARVLYEQGRFDEAEELTTRAEQGSSPDDLVNHVLLRGLRAKLLARRGEFEHAGRLAREAVRLAEASDALVMKADTFADLAEVLRLSGRRREAIHALEQAVALHRQKGNRAAEAATQAMLDDVRRDE